MSVCPTISPAEDQIHAQIAHEWRHSLHKGDGYKVTVVGETDRRCLQSMCAALPA